MTRNITIQDLSIAGFDQLLDVEGIKGGRRRSYSKPSYSRRSVSRHSISRVSKTTYRRRGR